MVINFICRASKAGKDGLSPLELSITIDGIRKIISLDRRAKARSFISKSQKFRANDEINSYIEALRTKLYSLEVEMINKNIAITTESFIEVYRHGFKSNMISILTFFQEHIEELQKKVTVGQITPSTISKYIVTKYYLERYIKESYNQRDYYLKEIKPSFVDEFYTYLIRTMSNNTAIQKMKQIKKILRLAFEEGYITSNPFKLVLKKDDVKVEPLSLEEVRKIKNKKISIKRLDNVRNLFIFECYTGLAFTDLANLTEENIVTDNDGNEWIIKDRQKTKVTSTIPLLPIAKKILLKYNNKLPSFSNQKYNAYLKELADVCGINKNLHSHLARHTFATILLNSGVDMLSVSKILGHSNSRITEKVYAKVLPDTIMSKVKSIQDKMI